MLMEGRRQREKKIMMTYDLIVKVSKRFCGSALDRQTSFTWGCETYGWPRGGLKVGSLFKEFDDSGCKYIRDIYFSPIRTDSSFVKVNT